ncbi:MAG: hypothetical protein ThorAB25_26390 [Candidatus Thorarchaeota archaeon AB_25]|nr:MAG: hypothetical protein ThorAB25_26390 [Candidatus Thorarchaeota archaeon AB_25]
MAKATLVDLATRRQYSELEKRADEFIENEGWDALLRRLKFVRPEGKARDAVIALLQLEAIRGTDSDVFKEFESLEGDNLHQVRANATEHAMGILKEQIENRHTYFLDIEAMTMTPYVVLVKDVIEARKRELEQLEGTPSRIEVLGTYYGFQILLTDGSKPNVTPSGTGYYRWRRRTWLDEKITENAANAVKSLTGELAKEVDMDKTYRTLGSNPVFKNRCTKVTATILADAVRLALYKTPGHRGTAARKLGRTGDSRALSFLHHRLPLEQNRRVRIAIAEALERVGHESSIDILKERVTAQGRYLSKEGEAMIRGLGGIYSLQCRETLIELLKAPGNTTRAVAIQSLGKQEPTGLVELISPYLVDKSRPVARASVLALIELGNEGEAAIRSKAAIVIKRIGYDKPSRTALQKMMSISGVGKMKPIHQYFSKRIDRLAREINNLQRQSNRSYSYWWSRRENRAKKNLLEYLRLASSHLNPPFDKNLIASVKSVLKKEREMMMNWAPGESQLARAVFPTTVEDPTYEQSHLSSYR